MSPQEAARLLHEGKLIVFPTETVYGLGALASNKKAVRKVFDVKGRPSHNPLILHIANPHQLDELVLDIPESAHRLMKAFWPGPLTICFRKSNIVSDEVTAGLPSVCVRTPDHPLAHEFLKNVGEAVAAPSANLSGKPSTTSFEDAKLQLGNKGVEFLDGGLTLIGLESTVVDCSQQGVVKLLRPGSVSVTDLESVLGEKILDETKNEQVTSPGQLLRHYAPKGELLVIVGNLQQRQRWLDRLSEDQKFSWAFGIVGKVNNAHLYSHLSVLSQSEEDMSMYASRLYSFLNWCDQIQAKHIVLSFPEKNHPLSATLMNRLEKASQGNIISLGGTFS